jgi:hypothetical protein
MQSIYELARWFGPVSSKTQEDARKQGMPTVCRLQLSCGSNLFVETKMSLLRCHIHDVMEFSTAFVPILALCSLFRTTVEEYVYGVMEIFFDSEKTEHVILVR